MKRITSLLVLVGLLSFAALAQPQAPTDLTAAVKISTFSSVEVNLSWKDSGAVNTKYNIYRKHGALADTASFRKLGISVRGLKFEDHGLQLNETYCYQVTAVTSAGESQPSNTVEVTAVPPVPENPGIVSGTVTNEATGAPVAFAYVNVFTMNPREKWNITYADSLGNYKIKLAPGTYYLYTSGQGFVPEYYDNVSSFRSATSFALVSGDSLTFNVALAARVLPVNHTITGTVKDAAGNPLQGTVCAISVKSNVRYNPGRGAKIDSLGNFSLSARENDTVVIYANPRAWNAFYPEFYNDKKTINEADRIAVTGDVTGIDIVLDPKPVYPNSISGKIQDTLGNGIAGVVNVFPRKAQRGPGKQPGTYTVQTDSLGVFTIANVEPGQYIALGVPAGSYKPSYFKYDGSSTLNWRLADSLVVDSASALANINITVKARPDSGFGHINGIVKASDGTKLSGAYVYAVNGSGVVYSVGLTDINGKYIIDGLVQDSYTIVSDKLGYASSSSSTSVTYSVQSASANFTLQPDGVTAVESQSLIANGFELSQNYPNPFNPSTRISYQILNDSKVSLKVFDLLGKEVATLVNQNQPAGSYVVTFDAGKLASGVYISKLEANGLSAVRKLVLMK